MPDEEGTAFEVVTRFMVERLIDEVSELRKRVDGILWLGAGALLVDVVFRLAGVK